MCSQRIPLKLAESGHIRTILRSTMGILRLPSVAQDDMQDLKLPDKSQFAIIHRMKTAEAFASAVSYRYAISSASFLPPRM